MTATQQYLVNGRPDSQISPLDRGFSYGDGVFRTMSSRHGRVAMWQRHYDKLLEDCNRLDIVCPSQELLAGDIDRLIHGDTSDAVIKIVVTRGEGTRGYALPALAQPNRMVIRTAYPQYPASYSTEGVRLYHCQLRLGHQPRIAGIKHLNRLENVLARMEWNDPTFADGVLQDIDGHVIECTSGNLFIRQGRSLLTPDLSLCGVSGVTREWLLACAAELELDPVVTRLTLDDMMRADEIIVCNSLYGAWQVTDFNNKRWPVLSLASRIRHLLQERT